MIRYHRERLKSLIVYYNNKYYFSHEYIYFNIVVRRWNDNDIRLISKISNDTKLLFINNNTIIRVDYYRFRYFDIKDVLDPELDYFIE